MLGLGVFFTGLVAFGLTVLSFRWIKQYKLGGWWQFTLGVLCGIPWIVFAMLAVLLVGATSG